MNKKLVLLKGRELMILPVETFEEKKQKISILCIL